MKKFVLAVSTFALALAGSAQEIPKGLSVNDAAPDFTSKNQNGETINLKEQLRNGAVVLVFYRGYWCPHCNKYLKQLEDSLALVKAKGATLITVTPEMEVNIARTIEKTKASYSILHDEGMAIMKSYDVDFSVDDKTISKYKEYGLDFTKINGDSIGTNLPVPAVYIISREGKIIYRHFDTNYTKRAPVSEILRHL